MFYRPTLMLSTVSTMARFGTPSAEGLHALVTSTALSYTHQQRAQHRQSVHRGSPISALALLD